jgi:hypothetical protein
MEHGPAPTPSPENEAPKDALDLEMDGLEDYDLDSEESNRYRAEQNAEPINNAVDEVLDTSDDDFIPLVSPAEEAAEAKAAKDAEKRQAEQETPEQALARTEKERRDRIEATITLEGSQRLDQFVLVKADEVMKGGEWLAHKAGDRKYLIKDGLQQWRINGTKNKKDRYEAKSKNAVFEFRRRKFAKKARLEALRLTRLRGFQAADRDAYAANFAKYKHEEGKEPELLSKGLRTERREARAEQLQSRINRMIAAEYKFTKLGRQDRKQKKREMKGEGNPQERERLRRLIVESSSVESLEGIGRKVFIDRLMSAPFVNENVRNAAMRSMQQFEEARRRDFDTSQDEFDLAG